MLLAARLAFEAGEAAAGAGLTIEYEIVSEQGVRIAGTFTDTVEIGETKRLTKKDVYG